MFVFVCVMSMLGSPKIVLLDEPSTGMDPQSKRSVWDTIEASFQEGEGIFSILYDYFCISMNY